MRAAPPEVDTFVTRLEQLRQADQRGALAALRRGVDRELGSDAGATAAFYALGPPGGHWESWCYVVAALFARQPVAAESPDGPLEPIDETDDGGPAEAVEPASGDGADGPSFAHALAKLIRQPDVNADGVERRVRALLDADAETVPFRLRQTVSLFRGHRIPWDWARLIDDLSRWSWAGRPTQRAWARTFYAAWSARQHAGESK